MTIRTKTYLTGTTYVAGQPAGSITSASHRDFVESADSWVGPAYTTLTSSAGAVTWAAASEKVNNAKITLTEATTVTITGAIEGGTYWLEVTQDGTGGWTLTLPSGTTIGATTGINTTASKKTGVLLIYNGASYMIIYGQEA